MGSGSAAAAEVGPFFELVGELAAAAVDTGFGFEVAVAESAGLGVATGCGRSGSCLAVVADLALGLRHS